MLIKSKISMYLMKKRVRFPVILQRAAGSGGRRWAPPWGRGASQVPAAITPASGEHLTVPLTPLPASGVLPGGCWGAGGVAAGR